MIRFLLSAKLGEQRWTQSDLARATHISLPQIHQWYHGYLERVPISQMERICIAMDCQPGDLFDYVPDDSAEAKRYRQTKPKKVLIDDD